MASVNPTDKFILTARNSTRRLRYLRILGEKVCSGSNAELEYGEAALQETRIETFQEMEELKKICCTEAERTQQLQSAVNQFTLQIQALQDKVNSLNDSSDFYDPETASSSGLSHVPSHL